MCVRGYLVQKLYEHTADLFGPLNM